VVIPRVRYERIDTMGDRGTLGRLERGTKRRAPRIAQDARFGPRYQTTSEGVRTQQRGKGGADSRTLAFASAAKERTAIIGLLRDF
jgi:hypothetical protein